MTNVAIPDWNAQGVLPPINSAAPTSFERSPYQVSLSDLVLRYATSEERKTILGGFLKFRAALHAAGLVQGFQWIDGSFLEHVELVEGRSPRDVDVVTFYHVSSGKTQQSLRAANPQLFDSQETKQAYHVDAHFVQLNQQRPEPLVRQSAYWYSLWSHRRNDLWKGYLQVDLAPGQDEVAQTRLDSKPIQVGGEP